MKTAIILILFILFAQCSSTNKTSENTTKFEITEASYERWSNPPVVKSDVREEGTDLFLRVKKWPKGYKPEYIIFRNRKSFPAIISETNKEGVLIEARIIIRSSVMSEVSEATGLSDRLVYTTDEGKTTFEEINQWQAR